MGIRAYFSGIPSNAPLAPISFLAEPQTDKALRQRVYHHKTIVIQSNGCKMPLSAKSSQA